MTMNDGTGSRTDSTGLTLDRIFANRGTFTLNPTECSSGTGSYGPNPSDGRVLVVLFKDERARKHGEVGSGDGAVFAIEVLCDYKSLALQLFGFGVLAAIVTDCSEIDEHVGDAGVIGPVEFVIDGKKLLVQIFGGVIVPGIEMTVRQFVKRVGEIGCDGGA